MKKEIDDLSDIPSLSSNDKKNNQEKDFSITSVPKKKTKKDLKEREIYFEKVYDDLTPVPKLSNLKRTRKLTNKELRKLWKLAMERND
jgi:hypothetical protein